MRAFALSFALLVSSFAFAAVDEKTCAAPAEITLELSQFTKVPASLKPHLKNNKLEVTARRQEDVRHCLEHGYINYTGASVQFTLHARSEESLPYMEFSFRVKSEPFPGENLRATFRVRDWSPAHVTFAPMAAPLTLELPGACGLIMSCIPGRNEAVGTAVVRASFLKP